MIPLIAKKYKRFVRYVEIFVLLLLLAVIYNYIPINDGKKTFYLSSNEPETIIAQIKAKGYEITMLDKLMLKLVEMPKEGWYTVDPKAHGRYMFFEHFYRQKSKKLMNIVVFAGETKEEMIQRLSNDMKLDKEKLKEYYLTKAKYKEGDILAGRYTVAREADESETLDYLFDQSAKRVEAIKQSFGNYSPASDQWEVIYKIASIIQKESNSPKEMPLISAVIYNRIGKNMRLQMDATLNYGPYSHTIVTPERIKEDKTRYNTYKHKGLPPAPLSTFSIDALKAAIKPTNKDYLYFMLTPNGDHNFTSSYKAHLKNIRTFRSYQKKRLYDKKKAKPLSSKHLAKKDRKVMVKKKRQNKNAKNKNIQCLINVAKPKAAKAEHNSSAKK